jgi:hypothetical protein
VPQPHLPRLHRGSQEIEDARKLERILAEVEAELPESGTPMRSDHTDSARLRGLPAIDAVCRARSGARTRSAPWSSRSAGDGGASKGSG